ncbi:hypothetical protein MRB53_027497 [Persea americana]|uniref:Uncharacterized protein n=1 Tax=Persea americana TaxID=3435 RepID=A0ACC2LMA7_PERAE|nr:hypothetical protein MRB53_027497 [Persea americana]
MNPRVANIKTFIFLKLQLFQFLRCGFDSSCKAYFQEVLVLPIWVGHSEREGTSNENHLDHWRWQYQRKAVWTIWTTDPPSDSSLGATLRCQDPLFFGTPLLLPSSEV